MYSSVKQPTSTATFHSQISLRAPSLPDFTHSPHGKVQNILNNSKGPPTHGIPREERDKTWSRQLSHKHLVNRLGKVASLSCLLSPCTSMELISR
ncbi:hypothetical protein AVEN_230844-1 [Araneus ventricosus]|uniref:Uncharacterized protein n=1 Tax=Araneus ventricosus TaxID=182803 RepID=A0A4Y2A3A9_ARAVE|nr:hypothetical protein AVEN_230844-1 [Araneus ventricosus]